MNTPSRSELLKMHFDDSSRIHALERAVELLEERLHAIEGKVLTVDGPDDRIVEFVVSRLHFAPWGGQPLVACWREALAAARRLHPPADVIAVRSDGSEFRAVLVVDAEGDYFTDADMLPTVARG